MCASPCSEVEVRVEFPLSNEEKRTVTDSWRMVEEHREFGERLFIQIFMYRPNVKRLFGLETYSASNLHTACKFRNHARNFVRFVDGVVVSLNGTDDEQRKCISTIRTIGGGHTSFTQGLNFDTEYWLCFVEAICDQMQDVLRSKVRNRKNLDTITKVWRKLFVFVIQLMKTAYLEKLETSHILVSIE